MSEADKNGRIARMVSDMHTVLGMEINESLIANHAELEKAVGKVSSPPRRRWWSRLAVWRDTAGTPTA